jgi:acetylornithine deacetylase/succinyl-diaminopimelate desuccinylase-like protein
MREELHALLAELVAIPSTYPPGDIGKIAGHCAAFLVPFGYEVALPGGNVVARMGKPEPSIVFNAHADTVDAGNRAAWRTDPFKATLVDGRVYGLGACNCKSAMAVHLWLAREIAGRGGPKRGEVVFTFVGDEENLGPGGLAHVREARAVKPTTLVVAAQTRNRLVLEERGVMWVRITTRGKAAHAGAPHTGDSAILRMQEVIGALSSLPQRASPTGHKTTLNVGRIRGGENINVVPDECVIEIDRRILPEDDFDACYRGIERTARGAGAASVELLTGTPGFSAPENGPGAMAFAEAISAVTGQAPQRLNVVGASDARYFARDGIEILVTGPGDGAESHQPNESVSLDEVVEAARIHLRAAEALLAIGFKPPRA